MTVKSVKPPHWTKPEHLVHLEMLPPTPVSPSVTAPGSVVGVGFIKLRRSREPCFPLCACCFFGTSAVVFALLLRLLLVWTHWWHGSLSQLLLSPSVSFISGTLFFKYKLQSYADPICTYMCIFRNVILCLCWNYLLTQCLSRKSSSMFLICF